MGKPVLQQVLALVALKAGRLSTLRVLATRGEWAVLEFQPGLHDDHSKERLQFEALAEMRDPADLLTFFPAAFPLTSGCSNVPSADFAPDGSGMRNLIALASAIVQEHKLPRGCPDMPLHAPSPNSSPRSLSALILAPSLLLGACLPEEPPEPPVEPDHFTVTRDTRRCASPMCGGYFLEAVNDTETLCADGTRQDRCYVAEVDWGKSGEPSFSSAVTLVRGTVAERDFPGFNRFGVMQAHEAWASVSKQEPNGRFVQLSDNGVRCISSPCFSTSAEALNFDGLINVSGFDLSEVRASERELSRAQEEYAAGRLIVSGALRSQPDAGPAGDGLAFVASQLFLPEAETKVEACTGDADCSKDEWCRYDGQSQSSCVPFVGEGSSCEGFTLPDFYERCSPELRCDMNPRVADAPGVCRRPCDASSDCDESQYCTTGGVCRPDGSCWVTADCREEGNLYPVLLCLGTLTCSDEISGGRCGVDCTTPPIDVRQ